GAREGRCLPKCSGPEWPVGEETVDANEQGKVEGQGYVARWAAAHVGHQVQVSGEGRHEGQASETPFRRQSADREGRRRRARAGLHRGDAWLEAGRRAPARRAHRASSAQRVQSREVELALLWATGSGLVRLV